MTFDIMTCTLDELEKNFPNYGNEGLRGRCQSELENLAQETLSILSENYSGKDSDYKTAVTAWVNNNKYLYEFSQNKHKNGIDFARAEARKTTQALAKENNISPESGSIYHETTECRAQQWEDNFDKLESSFSPISGLNLKTIYRGSACSKNEFDETLSENVTWGHMMACSIMKDYVPLHFAWKKYNISTDKSNIISYILEIDLLSPEDPSVIWTGSVNKGYPW